MKHNLRITSLIVFCFFLTTFVQSQINVTGVVTDNVGNTLPGVSVKIKDTNTGIITNNQGRFNINVSKSNDILIFSYLGYEELEKQVITRELMEVVLTEKLTSLDEVVVIGYQDVRKKDLTGSVASANVSEMIKAPVMNIDQALAGRVAGVEVTSNEGMPGGQMNIVIRGNNSVTQDNSPLYIIDGFPVEDPLIASSINPRDIESIDILKDASASAIYGSRGANGVVIISTKQGKIGDLAISYDGDFGVQRASRKIPIMDAYEFVRLQQEIYTTAEMQGDYGYFRTYDGKSYTLDDYRNTNQFDWQDMILKDAIQQSHNISLTGGTQKNRYNASLSYYDQDGIVINSNYNRLQGRIGTTIKREKLNVNLNVNYSSITTTGNSPSQNSYSGMNNLFFSVWGYRPVTQPGVDLNMLLDHTVDEGIDPLNDYRFNPILSLNNEYNKNINGYTQFNGFAEYELLKGLKLKVSGGYTIQNIKDERFYNSKTRYGALYKPNKVNATLGTTQRNTWLNENTLNYGTSINKQHNISALLGMSTQYSMFSNYRFTTIHIPNEELGMAGMSQGIPNVTFSSQSDWSMMSYFTRLGYNYKYKYYLTTTFRADGSSKFRGNNKFGYFPSLALAWNFTEETIFSKLKNIFDLGKLRLSWGQTGNNRIGDYDTFAQLNVIQSPIGAFVNLTDKITGVYPFNNNTSNKGPIPNNLPNEGLKWETTTQTNIGVDLSMFKDRLSFTVDLYDKMTSDLLLLAATPPSSGYGGAMKNIGKVNNQGLEFSLNTTNVAKNDFKWTTNFNIAFNRNKVIALSEDQESMLVNAPYDQQFTAPNYIVKKGYPLGLMYGYLYVGTYKFDDFDQSGSVYKLKPGIAKDVAEPNPQPGDQRFVDVNDDGVIDNNDMTFIGRGTPIHIGGFTNNFEYAGFDLSVFFQWSYGANILNANRLMFETGRRTKDLNRFASYADRWTVDNPTSDIPRLSNSSTNLLTSTRVVEDGSYLRLKTVALGYTINPKILQRIKISKCRFYISAQNLYTWTGYSGYDPEVSIRNSAITPGLDYSSYPRALTLTTGLSLNF